MTKIADSYTGHPPQDYLDLGCSGVSRYISHYYPKNASTEELIGYRNSGLVVVLNFEDGAQNAKGGRGQGNLDGEFAANYAKSLGYPQDCVIVFSVDFEPVESDLPVIVEYMAGAAGYGYPVGVYGNGAVIDACYDANVISTGWQTAAWSYGYLSPHATMYQNVFNYGGWVDFSTVEQTFIQAWGWNDPPPVVVPPKKPQPIPGPKKVDNEDMAFAQLAEAKGTTIQKRGQDEVKQGDIYLIWQDGSRTWLTDEEDVATWAEWLGVKAPGTLTTKFIADRPLNNK